MPDDPDEAYVLEALTGFRPSPGRPLAPLSVGDDAAIVPDPGLVTLDVMVEGVHFDDRLSPADVGWKLVAVNASDIGAMGGRPKWALLGLSLPAPLDRRWVDQFAQGLGAALARWGVALIGGDTTASPGPVVASLTMGGPAERVVARSGARPGDDLWVTGTLGDAAAGFLDGHPAGLAWLRRPEPPVELGAAIGAAGLAHAMMDLSDGLARDLPRLCAASGVGAVVQPASLPRGKALDGIDDPISRQVSFGDDYQLLVAAPPPSAAQLRALAAAHAVLLTRIGEVVERAPPRLAGRDWPPLAFAHFSAAR